MRLFPLDMPRIKTALKHVDIYKHDANPSLRSKIKRAVPLELICRSSSSNSSSRRRSKTNSFEKKHGRKDSYPRLAFQSANAPMSRLLDLQPPYPLVSGSPAYTTCHQLNHSTTCLPLLSGHSVKTDQLPTAPLAVGENLRDNGELRLSPTVYNRWKTPKSRRRAASLETSPPPRPAWTLGNLRLESTKLTESEACCTHNSPR